MGALEELDAERVPGLYYAPDFVDQGEAERLVERVDGASWKTLSARQVQNWGGYPHAKGMVSVPLPGYFAVVVDKVADVIRASPIEATWIDRDRPNHILVNQYLPGQGIDPHTDGEVYQPVAAILSLCSPLIMGFRKRKDGPGSPVVASVVLQEKSLLVISGPAYTDFLHGIAQREEECIDRATILEPHDARDGCQPSKWSRTRRISLTVRRVKKTLKTTIRL